MCGIYCCLATSTSVLVDHDHLKENLRRRGPNATNHICISHGNIQLDFFGYSSCLQEGLTKQPTSDEFGNILLWNGDVVRRQKDDDDDDEYKSDLDILRKKLSQISSSELPHFFSSLKGSHAFIYYEAQSHRLWFARDVLGRISLLLAWKDEALILTSVLHQSLSNEDYVEVPTNGIYYVELKNPRVCCLVPWNHLSISYPCLLKGFIDCQIQEIKLRSSLSFTKCFHDSSCNGWVTDVIKDKWSSSQILSHFYSLHTETVSRFISILKDAIYVRLKRKTRICKLCLSSKNHCSHSRIGILFSGGVDSCFLAALVCQLTENSNEFIDLYNVSFGEEKSPDRVTGRQALEELKTLYPKCTLQFHEINVSKEELKVQRAAHIVGLLKPSNSVLDDSIGCALWFATNSVKNSRILFCGNGSDEQLCGYSRHRAKFQEGNIVALLEEMDLEMSRISERNLGRDNRILEDHGVFSFLPFLDETLVNFLGSLPLELKADLRLRRGLGEKLLLRSAAFHYGLKRTAIEPKRAIQFGSRIAKLENKKEKGHQIAIRIP